MPLPTHTYTHAHTYTRTHTHTHMHTPPHSLAPWGRTQHPGDEAEEQGADDKGPVPVVRAGHGGDAEEDEDEGLADTAPHLQEILDGRVGLVGDVGLHVGAHHHSRGNESGVEGERVSGFRAGGTLQSPLCRS